MNFSKGDIIRCYSAIAGKEKYHLCIQESSEQYSAGFLFINSKSGYKGDLILKDKEIPCLCSSPTGNSIISCSLLIRLSLKKLKLFKAEKVGTLPISVAKELKIFTTTTDVLTEKERKIVVNGLTAIIKLK